MNEALLLGSVRQHELTEVAERLEEHLRASEARFRALFELGPVGIYSCDASGTIMEFNRLAAVLWEREPKPGDVTEKFCGASKLYLPDGTFLPHSQCPMAEVLSGRIATVHDVEVVVERLGGSRITVTTNIVPLKNDREEITGAINCFYDISERKRSREWLKLFRALIDRSSEAIEVVDPQTARFLDVNAKGCQDLGYSRSEFLSLKLFDIDLALEESNFPKIIDQLRNTNSMVWNGVHRRKDGFTFPIEASMKYVRLDRDYVVKVARDITQRRQAEASLQSSTEQLRALTFRLHTAREDESLRIARAIHDDLGHGLTRLNIELVFLVESLAKDPLPRAEIFKRTEMMSKQVEETVRAVERIATELRPSLLDDLGFDRPRFAHPSPMHERFCPNTSKRLCRTASPEGAESYQENLRERREYGQIGHRPAGICQAQLGGPDPEPRGPRGHRSGSACRASLAPVETEAIS